MIATELLYRYGASNHRYEKGDFIFEEGARCLYFHQILHGRVKMVNTSEDGKEFIQGYFSDGQSFGEPPLFYDGPYPAAAVAEADSMLIRLKKDDYMRMLRENVDTLFAVTTLFSNRLKQKTIMAVELAMYDPEHRISTLLRECCRDQKKAHPGERVLIPYTRQLLADMTGLRVETVIRVIKSLEDKGFLEIRDRKVYV